MSRRRAVCLFHLGLVYRTVCEFCSEASAVVQGLWFQSLTVDFSILELSSRNTILEQQIDLAKRAAFGLWQTEIAPNQAQDVGPRIKETGFGTPIPCYWESVAD